jgi:hypothetical protein
MNRYPSVRRAVEYMYQDQGIPDVLAEFFLPEEIDGEKADWLRVEQSLSQLSEKDLATLSVGDQEDAAVILASINEHDQEFVHRSLDELFMLIGG